MKKPLALVTGASSGIGKAYAQHLAASGYALYLVGQDHKRLEAAAAQFPQHVTQALALDLSQPASLEKLQKELPPLDVIVANAGITKVTRVGESSEEERRRLFYLLCGGVIDLLEQQIPIMRQRGGGRVVIISSIAAITPMSKSSIYAAAKAGVASYGASIADELKSSGVSVTTSLPGYVRTNAHARAGLQHLHKNIPSWMWMDSEQVVRETEAASLRARKQIVPGLVYRLARPFLASLLAQRVWQSLSGRSARKIGQLRSQQ